MRTGLSNGRSIVMARRTIAHDSCMAERCSFERTRCVTGATILCRRNVRWGFPRRFYAVVTGGAFADDICVIEYPRRKACYCVANAAVRCSWDMRS